MDESIRQFEQPDLCRQLIAFRCGYLAHVVSFSQNDRKSIGSSVLPGHEPALRRRIVHGILFG